MKGKKLRLTEKKFKSVDYCSIKCRRNKLKSRVVKMRKKPKNRIENFSREMEDLRKRGVKERSALKRSFTIKTKKIETKVSELLQSQQFLEESLRKSEEQRQVLVQETERLKAACTDVNLKKRQLSRQNENNKKQVLQIYNFLTSHTINISLIDQYRNKLIGKKIRELNLFDDKYYEEQIRNLGFPAVDNPVEHFLRLGHCFGINPHPLFSVNWYRDQNEDVAKSGMNTLAHYIRFGSNEYRDPHPAFSEKYYSNISRDLEFSPRLAHFLKFGADSRYDPHPKFDVGFYLDQNPDVTKAKINPLVHYLLYGHKENRNPHLLINEKWYKNKNDKEIPVGMSTLEFHIRIGLENGYVTSPGLDHVVRTRMDVGIRLKTIVVVAHSVSEQIFGAERSLIDVLKGIDPDRYRVILALPSARDTYIEQLRGYVDRFVFYKREWWDASKPTFVPNSILFENLFREEEVDLVYVNTIMVTNPSLTARKMNIPVITHVRELIDFDQNLRDHIGLNTQQIKDLVSDRSDLLITNSETTDQLFRSTNKAAFVPNAIDIPKTATENLIEKSGNLRVGMLSSNLKKKGVWELYKLAVLSEKRSLPVDFIAFGPETSDVKKIKQKIKLNGGPGNISFPGYVDDPIEAIKSVNVVVNFSIFAESFGRTVVEAMSVCRPVICFAHGALPSVIEDKKTGFLIPYLEPEKAIPYLQVFLKSPKKLKTMGLAGRKRAQKKYSHEVLWKNIDNVFQAVLNENRDRVLKVAATPMQEIEEKTFGSENKISVVVPNYNYAQYLEERIGSILSQTHRPDEIIFLDDCSTDGSVSFARKILMEQKKLPTGIPFKILRNKENAGVYKQWLKGIRAAKNEWVWIAEADDTSDPLFLETLIKKITPATNLIYCQSKKIDGNGDIISANNFAHTDDVSVTKWRSDYINNGIQEVATSLVYRNSIPNTSSVIFRKSATKKIESLLGKFNYCGDWFFYSYLLKAGDIAYSSLALNNFRRHNAGVTKQQSKTSAYLNELVRIRQYICSEFPILPRQIERMDWFLNRDYKITNVKTNSKHSKALPYLNKARDEVAGRKRFGFITTNNGSYNGGSEQLWQESAMSLRAAGHDVVVLIKNWAPMPQIIQDLKGAGVRVFYKDENGFNAFIETRPDFVIVSIGDQDEGIEYYDYLTENNISYSIVNQLTKEERYWHIRESKQTAVSRGYGNAKAVFFTCKNNRLVMEARIKVKIGNARYHYNPYHIDREYVPDFPSQKTGLSIAIPSKLLFIHKGQDLVIEVLRNPKWRDRDVCFNFYGTGPDSESLQNMIDKYGLGMCHVKGRVDDISNIWRENHALLMPSRMEGLPIMMVSAMLSERMCIATDIGGHSEVIENGVTGFIAPNPTVDALSETLELAYKHREKWKKMGQLGRQSILEFLPEDPVQNFIEQITELIGDSELRL